MLSTFDEGVYFPLAKTQNGSRISGEAVTAGTSPVTATFKDLHAKAELLVYQGITLSPIIVILPFDPNNPKR